jgi:hypothetical protein
MTIKIGTIQEMTGEGYEILVDAETRSVMLAKFFDGKFIRPPENGTQSGSEPTIITL